MRRLYRESTPLTPTNAVSTADVRADHRNKVSESHRVAAGERGDLTIAESPAGSIYAWVAMADRVVVLMRQLPLLVRVYSSHRD
jgi:hypothetical protein